MTDDDFDSLLADVIGCAGDYANAAQRAQIDKMEGYVERLRRGRTKLSVARATTLDVLSAFLSPDLARKAVGEIFGDDDDKRGGVQGEIE